MPKAVLIVEMHESCMECDFCDAFGECKYVGYVGEAFEHGLRYIKCPLKPIPEKKNEFQAYALFPSDNRSYVNGVADGYNRCVDEILGNKKI